MFVDLVRDVRFGLRRLARSPGSAGAVLLMLALGIGASTTIFSLVHGVLLKPLPYPASDRIMVLRETNLSRGWISFPLSGDDFLDWQERTQSFDLMAAYQSTNPTQTGVDRPEMLTAYRVTADYLATLGGNLAFGRGITGEDMHPGAERVAVLENGFWRRSFGGDPQVLGRPLVLDGETHTIVGILEEGWRPLEQVNTDVILPLPLTRHPSRRGGHWLSAVARRKSGVTEDQAKAEISSVTASLAAEYPWSNEGWGGLAVPITEFLLGAAGPQLFLFFGAVMMVLLVACANVGNIMMGRAAARDRELAIRMALGAGCGRVVRLFLTESLLLSGIGGCLGIALAHVALPSLLLAWPGSMPRLDQVRIEGIAWLFAGGAALVIGLTAGLVPPLTRQAFAFGDSLGGLARRLVRGQPRSRLRAGLVGAEMAAAVVLLVSSGLLVRSFVALQTSDPGFDAEDRLVFTTPFPGEYRPTPAEIRTFADAALRGLRTVPGVVAPAITTFVPIRGGVDVRWQVTFEGQPPPGPTELDEVHLYRVSSDYLEAMGIPLVMGRALTPEDEQGSSPVALVSESFARTHYPGESPLGGRIRIGGGEPPFMEIVGVVGDVQDLVLGEVSLPQVYEPFRQRERVVTAISFVTKTSVDPLGLVEAFRAEILAVKADQPLVGIQTMEDALSDYVALPRFRTFLMTSFGMFALLLAVIGVYGVVSFSVSQRLPEFGVRMALGADAPSILAQVLKDGAPMVVTGVIIGLVGAFALSRVLESMLFEVGARDVVVFTAVPLILLVSAGLAMLVPAVRAARVEPVRTLAGE